MEKVYTLTRFLYDSFNVSYLLLFALLALAFHIIREAPKPDNYWGGVFNDDAGKRSALRVATLIALAVHSAVVLYLATSVISMSQMHVKDALDSLLWHVGIYAGVWSGASVVSKALDIVAVKFAAKVGP